MRKGKLEKLEKIILDASKIEPESCLEYLKEEMEKELRFNFHDGINGGIEAYQKALYYWWEIRENKQPLKSIKPRRLEELPGINFRFKGVDYHIHGIFHGFSKVSERVSRYFAAHLKKYNKKGDLVILEEDFDKFLRLEDKGVDYLLLNDHKYLNDVLPFWRSLKMPSIIISGERYLLILDNLYKFYRDESYLPIIREIGRRMRLPSPLDMAFLSFFQRGEKVSIERSKFMLACIVEYAKFKKAKEVHLLCGHGHESHIRYFSRTNIPEIVKELPIEDYLPEILKI